MIQSPQSGMLNTRIVHQTSHYFLLLLKKNGTSTETKRYQYQVEV